MSKLIKESHRYRIKAVGQLTGLSTHVIRKWEERYQLLSPVRGTNGYRLYSEDDLQLLMYIRWQIDTGQTIGQLANMGLTNLQYAMNHSPIETHSLSGEFQPSAVTLISAARRLDQDTAESSIYALVSQLGLEEALHQVLFPVLRIIGDLWHQGQITMGGEHLITQTIRHHLATSLRQNHHSNCPTVIVACAPGNFHEIGAMTSVFVLQKQGWNSIYMGVNSDIDLVHLACERRQGKLVILSTVLERPEKEFQHMTKQITNKILPLCPVIIGGRGAAKYSTFLEEQGITYIEHVQQLQSLKPSHSNFTHHTYFTKPQKELIT
ncbi:MAG: MerR family transcriptional regulator [Nitrospirales bacterium]